MHFIGQRVAITMAFPEQHLWGKRGTITDIDKYDPNDVAFLELDWPIQVLIDAPGIDQLQVAKEEIEPLVMPKANDRVWCYPHSDRGFEATVIFGNENGSYCVSGPTGPSAVFVAAEDVVLFDENHNQKRAYYRDGAKLQCRERGDESSTWVDLVVPPIWDKTWDYRVKPTPVPYVKRVQMFALDVETAYDIPVFLPKPITFGIDFAENKNPALDWVKHAGSVMPVTGSVRVQTRQQDGEIDEGHANEFYWWHDTEFPQGNIVEWRLESAAKKTVDFDHNGNRIAETGFDKASNPKEAVGVRKVPYSVVPANVHALVAVGLSEGAGKYGRHNYRGVGVRASTYYDATLRHEADWWEGENIDTDSGLHHVIKAICSLYVLADSILRGNVTDDRPPPSPKGWLKEANEHAARMVDKAERLAKEKGSRPHDWVITDEVKA